VGFGPVRYGYYKNEEKTMTKTAIKTKSNGKETALAEHQITDGAQFAMEMRKPYRLDIQVTGTSPLLMHNYNVQAVEEKSKAKKNSAIKKTDDIESYCYRDEKGYLAIPANVFIAALGMAAKSEPDPRSPRKSAHDLVRGAIIPGEFVAYFEPKTKTYDYEDKQRCVVQQAAIPRIRPAMRSGWQLTFSILIQTPEYISPEFVNHLSVNAGLLCGLCDGRKIGYGRFQVTAFKVVELE
jgi:hypothetical protein